MNAEHLPAISRAGASDEIDLVALAKALWQGRWTIGIAIIAALATAVIYLNVASYKYTAQLSLTPAQSAGSSLASKLGGLSELASLAGINAPQDPSALAFALYKEGVHSRSLADALAQHQDLMRVIYYKEWNPAKDKWEEPRGVLRAVARSVKKLLGVPGVAWTPPTGARLQEYMDDEVRVEEDSKKPFITIEFDHEDPAFAVRFLTALNTELDNFLRQKALARTTGNIAYLSAQLAKINIAEHRQALAEALSEQEKQKMAASSSAPYAADPFGKVNASPRPTSPKPVLVLAASLLAGFVFGILIVMARNRLGYYRQALGAGG